MRAMDEVEESVEDGFLATSYQRRLKRVIVVEDDTEMRAWLAESLRDAGFEVRSAGDSLTALCLQLRVPADAVVTDWKMPDMDGLALLAALRRCTPDLPVIVVTAYPEEDLIRQVQELGAFSCLPKPFRRAQLLAHVQGALLTARRPRGDATQAEGTA